MASSNAVDAALLLIHFYLYGNFPICNVHFDQSLLCLLLFYTFFLFEIQFLSLYKMFEEEINELKDQCDQVTAPDGSARIC